LTSNSERGRGEVSGAPYRLLYAIETSRAGGTQTAILTLTRLIDRARFEPIVALPEPGWLGEKLAARAVASVRVDNRIGARGFDWRLLRSLVACIRAQRIDLVHSFLFTMNLYGAVAAAITRRPIIVSLRSTHYDFAKRHRVWCWRLIRRLSDAIVAVSDDAAETLWRAGGVPRTQIRVIPNGVDVTRFRPQPGAERPPHLPAPPLIATVGRVCEVKGQEHLIRALPAVERAVGRVSLAIFGEKIEPTFSRLQRLCAELGVSERVYFAGLRDDIAEVLPWVDVFALPSLSEGMSNALLEAMAAGRPVAATAVGGNRELIRDGENGLLVPAADADALAWALCRLISDRRLAAAMGGAARRAAQQRFSLEAMVRQHEQLYLRVLGGERD
jgi:glycosyltransferase involved in cell wall biosynthesis